jgi:capsular polysaccharide biosynthesis protein
MWVARVEERVHRMVPDGEPPRHPRFVGDADLVVPRVVVAELPDARVLSRHRVVIDRSGRMIEEFGGIYWGTRRWTEHQIFLHPFPEPPLDVDGLLAVLAGRGDVNYYHFLLDILPRLAFLETAGLPSPDRWYAPLQGPFQREVLELAGFLPKPAVIDADLAPHVRAQALLVPGLPDTHKRTPRWIVPFIRERLRRADLECIPGRRIYITRGTVRNNRIVRNEREVVEMLGERGFIVVDPGTMPVSEQIRTFAEAECIVAPHGAALTNLAFASSGACIIELFASDYVDLAYWKIADSIPGVTYRYLVAAGPPARPGWGQSGVMSDITVDVRALRRALDALPAAAAAV